MWRKIKKILTKAPKKLLRFRPGFLQPTSAPAGPPAASVLPPHPLTENKNAQKIRRVETPIPNDAQDLLKPKVNRELKPKPKVYRELKPRSKVNRELKPRPTPYTSIYPCLPTNDDTPPTQVCPKGTSSTAHAKIVHIQLHLRFPMFFQWWMWRMKILRDPSSSPDIFCDALEVTCPFLEDQRRITSSPRPTATWQ